MIQILHLPLRGIENVRQEGRAYSAVPQAPAVALYPMLGYPGAIGTQAV